MQFRAAVPYGGLIVLLLCLRVAVAEEVVRQSRGLPEGMKDTQDARDVPESPRDSLARITVPEGFRVSLFAGEPDVAQPIAFTFDDRGRVWVVECYSHPEWRTEGRDRVVILEDTDNDGQFDRRTVFWDQGNYLSGIAVGHGGVYLCNTPNLIFIADHDGDDRPDGKPQVLLNGWNRKNPHNVFNNLIFGPDGWLYGCVGQRAESRIGRPDQPEEERKTISRGIWRYHPYDHEFEVVAIGAVNPWGLDFDQHGQAFFSNCVLPHLWHLVPGAWYQRRKGERDNPYAYQRMQPCCDHRHWADGDWTDSRGGHSRHGDAGGGHAHTGSMIYQGDNWPDKYRHSYFVGNLHGNRINNDLLDRKGSGYIARHGDDFLFGNSPWFRCLSQKYGPDGGVYISDWHDVGECHDNDGAHRSSGRIYKVVFGAAPEPPRLNIAALSDAQLVQLQSHRNAWMGRHARRVLQERAEQGSDMNEALKPLELLLHSDNEPAVRLRALWSLYVINATTSEKLLSLTHDADEHVRCWAVRLLTDRKQPDDIVESALVELANQESSAIVRLFLASAIQRVSVEAKWGLAAALSKHEADQDDDNIPLMIWYGIEPAVAVDTERAIGLLKSSRLSLIRQNIARRLSEK